MSSLVLPDSFSEWEEERLEIYKLKGHMLQLKKVVKRLETSKSLSEKALTSAEGHHEKQTATRTEAGVRELARASQYQRRARFRICIIIACVLTVIILLVLVLKYGLHKV